MGTESAISCTTYATHVPQANCIMFRSGGHKFAVLQFFVCLRVLIFLFSWHLYTVYGIYLVVISSTQAHSPLLTGYIRIQQRRSHDL